MAGVRRASSIGNHWSKERCLKRLEKIDTRISEILSECERIDQSEFNDSSMVKMKEELADNETLRRKVTDILDKLNPEKVFNDLREDAVILCWEKPGPGALCHRRLIAEWFHDRLQIKVNEL